MSAGERDAEIGRMERHFQSQAEGRLPYNRGFVVVGELKSNRLLPNSLSKAKGLKSLAPKRAMDEKFKQTVSAEYRHRRRKKSRHHRRRRYRRRRRPRRRRHRRKRRRRQRKGRRRRHRHRHRHRHRRRKRRRTHKAGRKRRRRTRRG